MNKQSNNAVNWGGYVCILHRRFTCPLSPAA